MIEWAGEPMDLGLEPHPEGGSFARFFTSESASAIYYHLSSGERSRFHRLTLSHELWLHHRGRTVLLHLMAPDGSERRVLRVGAGEDDVPAADVPPGWWQAAELDPADASAAADALVSCVVTPPFAWDQWQLLRDFGDQAVELDESTRAKFL